MIFMQALYEGPDDLVEKMKSLSMIQECFLAGERCLIHCTFLRLRLEEFWADLNQIRPFRQPEDKSGRGS